jgi:hypothetical protein
VACRGGWGDVGNDLGGWDVRCLICVAADDVDFFDQARRAADEIPKAAFVPIEATDHLGVDVARVDPILPAVLRTLRETR